MHEYTLNEFCERIKKEVADNLEITGVFNKGYKAQLVDRLENNGIVLTALVLMDNEHNIAPCVYLNQFYEKYLEGTTITDISNEVIQMYLHQLPKENFDVESILNLEKVKSQIIRRVVNFESNKDMLESRPYKLEEDLAIIYAVHLPADLSLDYETASIPITYSLFERYRISVDELDALAKENTPKQLNPEIVELKEYVFHNQKEYIMDTFGVNEEKAREIFMRTYDAPDMYIVSNDNYLFGAVNILDESVQDKLAEIFGNKYCVIPSSVHDVLVTSFSGDYNDHELLKEMIMDVNMTDVRSDEMLSDKPYMVDAVNHKFIQMDRAEEYFKSIEEQRKQEKKREEILREEKNQRENKEVDESTGSVRHRLSPDKRNIKL